MLRRFTSPDGSRDRNSSGGVDGTARLGENRAMKIHVLLEQNGKTAVGFAVPEETVLALGKGKRPPVSVTINGYTYRSTVAPMGGRYLVGVSAENRAGAGVAGGQEVDVDLELDTAPREIELPADFAAALAGDPDAGAPSKPCRRATRATTPP